MLCFHTTRTAEFSTSLTCLSLPRKGSSVENTQIVTKSVDTRGTKRRQNESVTVKFPRTLLGIEPGTSSSMSLCHNQLRQNTSDAIRNNEQKILNKFHVDESDLSTRDEQKSPATCFGTISVPSSDSLPLRFKAVLSKWSAVSSTVTHRLTY